MAKRYALIIGNSLYRDKTLAKLKSPDADVGALKDALSDSEMGGFDDVNLVFNSATHIVRKEITTFFSRKFREDLLLLYFSGHGVLDDRGKLYLALKDTDTKLLRGTAIPARYITEEMDTSRSQRQILILDCCHSGAFERGMKGAPGASVGTAGAFEGTGFGRVVLTASDATQYAWEGDQVIGDAENSLFTHYLVKGIQTGEADANGDGRITVDELYDYAYGQILKQTPKQTPGKWTFKEQGDLIISLSPKAAGIQEQLQVPSISSAEKQLEKLYTEGLSSFLSQDWTAARKSFEKILETASDYLDVKVKLAEVIANQKSDNLYRLALSRHEENDLGESIKLLEELYANNPSYKDVAAKLEQFKDEKKLLDLTSEAKELHDLGNFKAVVGVYDKIFTAFPDFEDTSGLLERAKKENQKIEKEKELEYLYSAANFELNSGRLQEAKRLLLQVQEIERGYKETYQLIRHINEQLEKEARMPTPISKPGPAAAPTLKEKKSLMQWFSSLSNKAALAIGIVGVLVVSASVFTVGYILWRNSPIAQQDNNLASDGGGVVSPTTNRVGGWLDTITMSVVSADSAVSKVESGAIDIFASGLSSPKDLAKLDGTNLERSEHAGLYYDITLNPAGPVFSGNGKFNPFASPKIRQAMNWLIDREAISREAYGGNAVPKYTHIMHGFPEFVRYQDKIEHYEDLYAYSPDIAERVISEEMQAMGAEKVGGQWSYRGSPVELIFLIRTDSDGTRRPMGDMIAGWLEDIGFVVDRHYGTSSELSPFWISGNVDDGLWNLYTGAWGQSAIPRDEGDAFQFFYTPNSGYGTYSLWQSYYISPADQAIADALAARTYKTLAERDTLFDQALEWFFKYSYRIWVVDGVSSSFWNPDLSVSYDLAGGVDINAFWPYTLRYDDQEGGSVKWGSADLFVDPANPVAGSNWTYDTQWRLATSDWDAIPDPTTGLPLAQRLDRTEVTVQTGFPVGKTHSWVSLSSAAEISVPGDAWVDWDAQEQVFITVAEKAPGGLEANAKVVYYYPQELWDVKWHDGSSLTVADFIMALIMRFDRGKSASALYDSSYEPSMESFLGGFKGVRFISENPLTIEYYTDSMYLDAEQIAVAGRAAFWPEYGYGQAGWHMIAVANRAEAARKLAYSANKAESRGIEWMSFVGGPSLAILNAELMEAKSESYIPFEPTLGAYISAQEAAARYANLEDFYEEYGHFWVGTGPYILSDANLTAKTATLSCNSEYIDPSDKWAGIVNP